MSLVGNVQLVAGNSRAIDPILNVLKKEGIDPAGNPDVYVREYASFGVEEARGLALRSSSRAVASSRRVFVIVAAQMTTEAQNALLKTLEEPSGDALFFLVVPSPETLLPTLRSRGSVLELESANETAPISVDTFLKAGPAERIEMLKPLLDKTEDDKRDVGAGIAFLAALERQLAENPKDHAAGLAAVYRARKYWTDKGSLGKALLEQVALLL